MSYEKQNFVDGQTLTAAQLNHMEAGIAAAWDMAGSGTGGSAVMGIPGAAGDGETDDTDGGAEPEQLRGGRRKQKVQIL